MNIMPIIASQIGIPAAIAALNARRHKKEEEAKKNKENNDNQSQDRAPQQQMRCPMTIMPNQLPRPSVDNPLPWKAIPHTDDFGGTVVAKSGHVVTDLGSSEDATFIAASASSFYNLVERYEYMRDLVIKLLHVAEIADIDVETVKSICALKGVDSSVVYTIRAASADLLSKARAAVCIRAMEEVEMEIRK